MLLPRSVRRNAEEMNDFLRGMQAWEKQVRWSIRLRHGVAASRSGFPAPPPGALPCRGVVIIRLCPPPVGRLHQAKKKDRAILQQRGAKRSMPPVRASGGTVRTQLSQAGPPVERPSATTSAASASGRVAERRGGGGQQVMSSERLWIASMHAISSA